MRRILVFLMLALVPLAGCLGDDSPDEIQDDPASGDDATFEPHVVVAVPDSGINPYHEIFFRPERTAEPCTYIQDMPCDLEPLNLSVGQHDDWQAAFDADQDLWESVEPETWYWIPQTAFVAVMAEGPCDGVCILDDTNMHGTGTTSSILTENPDALLAFKEGGSTIQPFLDKALPVDVYSVSWGNVAPTPTPTQVCPNGMDAPIYVLAAGNDPRSTLTDCRPGNPRVIAVGGAYAADGTEEPLAGKQADVVSYYCRPTAQTNAVSEMRESYCGTSFATPTVAGALSEVILAVREASGYTGSLTDGMIDPVLGITIGELRDAMNRTASYDPESEYPNTSIGAPRNDEAPWLQWGWGFYDGTVADASIAHLLDTPAPEKAEDAVTYMETVYTGRQTLYG